MVAIIVIAGFAASFVCLILLPFWIAAFWTRQNRDLIDRISVILPGETDVEHRRRSAENLLHDSGHRLGQIVGGLIMLALWVFLSRYF